MWTQVSRYGHWVSTSRNRVPVKHKVSPFGGGYNSDVFNLRLLKRIVE